MKKARRQDLKTNELSIYLQQIYETASRNANYVIGGAVAVIAILAICFMVYNNRQTTRQAAWNDYYNLRDKRARMAQSSDDKPDQKGDLISEVRRLADEHKSDSELGPRVMELEVDIAFTQALMASPVTDREKRLSLLKEARTAATQILDRYGSQPEAAHRARLTLAAIEESLFLMGEGNLDTARKLYQAIVDASPNPFVAEAKRQLETLAKRTTKIELVATRPAEPPASQPVVSSQPAPPPPLLVPPPTPVVPASPPPAPAPAPTSAPGNQ